MRTGFLNWREPKFARKLVTVLVRARKVLQAYYFVFVQVDLSDNAQSLHEDYEGLFFYFIDQVISEGLASELFNISLKNHERVLLRNYFETNPEHAKYYILYLLKLDQVIEAVEFYKDYSENIPSTDSIYRFLLWRISQLSEIIRSRIQENYPQLYQEAREYSSSNASQPEKTMLEEFGGKSVIRSTMTRGGNNTNSSPQQLLESAVDRLYLSSEKKGRVDFSVQQVQAEISHKEGNKERLGLVSVEDRRKNVKKQAEEGGEMEEEGAQLRTTSNEGFKRKRVNFEIDGNNKTMEEEEYKSNALSQPRVSLGGGNGFYSSQRSQPVRTWEEKYQF